MLAKSPEEWRDNILKRDNHICQICSNYGNVADHIKPQIPFPELALEVDNGRCLCWNCHQKYGARDKSQNRSKIRVYANGMAHFPQGIVNLGYWGNLKAKPEVCALLIEKPNAKTEDIIKSLEILRAHYKHLVELKKGK